MLRGKRILLGVTGGIAAYKSPDIVSRIKKLGGEVDVVMTQAATKFVNPLSLQTMSGNKVHLEMFENLKETDVEHISLAKRPDLILIAPASSNTIGKIANGICDNLLTTVIAATKKPVIFAASMNTNMYLNPIFQKNMTKLKSLNYEFIDPIEGLLACRDQGVGKMAEPEDIVNYLVDRLKEGKDLSKLRFTITAGPTISPLDPVRYITNYSSGKMGYELAKEVIKRGGVVNLISGPSNEEVVPGANLIRINTSEELLEEVLRLKDDTDILISAAAPLDYKVAEYSREKIKKNEEDLIVRFKRSPDIAKEFSKIKKTSQLSIGFAAESENVYKNALKKLYDKDFDMIIANDISREGAGFRSNTNIVSIINKKGEEESYPIMSKKELSKIIIDKILLLKRNRG